MKSVALILAAAMLVPAAAHAQTEPTSPQIVAGQALKKKLGELPKGSKAPMLTGADGPTIRAAFDAAATRKLPLDAGLAGATCVSIGEAIVAYVDFANRMVAGAPDAQKASDALLDTVQEELTMGAVAAKPWPASRTDSSGVTDSGATGRSWQASRTDGGAFMRASTACSVALGGGRTSAPSVTRMRQVEQRPRPPHSAAWGMPLPRLASRTEVPRGTVTARPPG